MNPESQNGCQHGKYAPLCQRHSHTVAMAEEGACFNAEGYMDGPEHQQVRGLNWTATLQIAPDVIRGYPIIPWGKAVQREVELPSQGHLWRNGAMFFLMDDLARLGTQHYRAQWPAIQKQLAW